jgi:uncharacterized protein YlxW (UPF0749 family)
MDSNCLIGFTVLTGGYLGIVAMFLDYRAKMNKKGVELEKRTKQLEKKNGAEQEQLSQLKKEVQQLKHVLQEKSKQ